MKKLIQFLSILGFWPFVFFFTLIAIIFAESLVMIQSYWLNDDFFKTDLLIVGFTTPIIVGFIIFTTIASLIKHLRDLQNEKDELFLELKENSELLRSVIDENPDPVVVKNWDGKFVLSNKACAELYGTTPEDMIGKDDGDYIPDQNLAEFFRRNIQEIMSEGEMKVVYENSIDVKTNERRDYKSVKIPYKNSKAEAQILVVAHDITEQKRKEEELQFMNYALNKVSDASYLINENGNILKVNESACKALGYTKDELESMSVFEISTKANKESWSDLFHHLSKNMIETNHIRKDKTQFSVEVSSTYVEYLGKKYNLAFARDITEKKEQQKKLEQMAHFDALTNLPNRVVLADRIEQAMAQIARREDSIAIAYIDLDGFKEINDTYGHDIGDSLLQSLALKMNQILREGDTVARMGGDEFVALLVDISDKKVVDSFLGRLLSVLSEPIFIDGYKLYVSASIGVTFYPQLEDISSEQLIRQADQAMYEAKVSGKNRFSVFDDSKEKNLYKYNKELQRVQEALESNEFELYYQPKVNIKTGEIKGAEALIRWNHPEKGLLPPISFLPLIENHTLSVDVDIWVLEQALEQLNKWHKEGVIYSISVNIGAQILQHMDFVSILKKTLDSFNYIDRSLLTLEILETSALKDLDHISSVIVECSKLGVHFSLDDFGTGYSSLVYLKSLRVSEIKIDRSFIRDMLEDSDDLSIVDGVLGFALAFDREVVAEGVESIEHGSMLLQLGCELVQGYIIAKPMPITSFVKWAEDWELPSEWHGIGTINRSDMPILFASVEYRAWMKEIKKHLNEPNGPYEPSEYKECRFGKWLNGRGKELYGDMDIYKNIVKEHTKIHEVVLEFLELKAGQKTKDIEQVIVMFDKISYQLLNQLNILYSK